MDPDEVGEQRGEGPSKSDRVLLGYSRVREVDNNPQVPKDDVLLARVPASVEQTHESSIEGGLDPLVVDDWLDEVEKHFRAITVPNDQLKITLATYKFVSHMEVWWKTMTSAHDIDSMSWDAFKGLFFDKYFPQTKRWELRMQFDELEQGDMSVTEYENKFTSLSRFSTEVLGNEEVKT
ncbi:uncharacterized protein LOC132305034 [Cornus florida]|uniref:uncharacterized protein LOC132305034 n=1 Tax=Cornus florida TaxID=4283 RepID=UPI0028A13C4D|nr:uncharacterized protein LOC132305034 [Cornus florida]